MGQLKDQLQRDMQQAMKDHDAVTLSTLRMAIAAIKSAQVAGDEARELSDAEELKLLHKEVSSRKDSAETYDAGNRPELAAKERAEIEVLQRYLPAELTADELQAIVDEEVAKASEGGEKPTMRQMGAIIKAVNARAQGRADGGSVAAAVKAKLA